MVRHNQDSYVIDTNILINFGIFTPHNVHKKFWSSMEEALQNDKIIILEEVAYECKEGDLKIWIDEQRKAGRVVSVNADIRARAMYINEEYQLLTYGTNKSGKRVQKSKADSIIIAYAENNKHTVFTWESDKQVKQMKRVVYPEYASMKIPAVCKALDIPYIRYPDQVLKKVIQPIS